MRWKTKQWNSPSQSSKGSGWGTRVYLWRIRVDIWQNQYNIIKLKNKRKEKRTLKSENILKDLWNNIRWNNIHIIGVSEGEEGNGQKNYLKQ